MKKVILFKHDTKLPVTISDISDPVNSIYSDKQILPSGDIIRITEAIEDNSIIFETYHINGLEIELHEPRKDSYQEWSAENLQWQDIPNKTDILINTYKEIINNFASQKIISKYPYYYQLNAPYDFGINSTEVISMRAWIDNIRGLANIAKSAIASANTLPEITTIVDNFKTELGNIA